MPKTILPTKGVQAKKQRAAHAQEIMQRLEKVYPKAHIILNFSNPWELLVAVMLSAQCTDVQVNKTTTTLFKKYSTIQDYVHATQQEFEKDIFSTGFYRAKARHILATAKLVHTQFHGQVPKTMEEMLTLPGVARKTANVVLSNAYGINYGIAVDTHVKRLSMRLGLTTNTDPNKIEQDLIAIIPQQAWNEITYLLIEHGRATCIAQKPKCSTCVLQDICPSSNLS